MVLGVRCFESIYVVMFVTVNGFGMMIEFVLSRWLLFWYRGMLSQQ